MIDHLDNLLRHLFIKEMAEITTDAQVRFQPPDQDWRTYVSGLQGVALNVYLVDIRENRKLRSNERVREFRNGDAFDTQAPSRIDCHYLISAWSPAQPGPAIEPTLDELATLYRVTGVLINNEPLVPIRVYYPSPLPGTFPAQIAEAELPTTILPVEGFPKLAEFWGTVEWRWKPSVYLLITLPVILSEQFAGPMVTTRITEYRQTDKPETAETWIQIGGHVMDATVAPPVSTKGAWVQLETTMGEPIQNTTTDDQGRFTFINLKAGTYQLRWRAVGKADPPPRTIQIPSPTGEYDLKFT